jgi:Asp-tRNA(Asn)/Glu-tRNA(Gln) amidotransferase A subunit family amidase
VEIWELPCTDLAGGVRAGRLSAAEVVAAFLARIERIDRAVNAFTVVDGDRALAAARVLDARIARGEDPGPLAGLPLAVKDAEDVAGLRTTHGDPALAGAPPAAEDSIQVARLRAAGAVVVGKTNLPAHSGKAETDNLLFGVTRNPWAPEHVAGGSSGGSAAALTTAMAALATGADAGGSIRIPAGACNVAGFKPTTGVVPYGDDVPSWGPITARGPMARRMADTALALDAAAGPSARDPYAVALPGSFVAAARIRSLRGVRVAWSPTLGYASPEPRVVEVCAAAVEVLRELGATVDTGRAWVKPVLVGLVDELLRAGPDLDPARLEPHLLDWVARARRMSALDLAAAERVRHEVGLRLARVFASYDLIASPVTSRPAPRIDTPGPWSELAHVFNLSTGPAASVPAGFVTEAGAELPVGLHLGGARLDDLRVMAAAAALDAAVGASERLAPTPPCT